MKIKRFTASSMREAMRMVRDEQGADAVILSSRATEEGVEVVAAVDYDASLMLQADKHPERSAERAAERAAERQHDHQNEFIRPAPQPVVPPALAAEAVAPRQTQMRMPSPAASAQVIQPNQFANADILHLQRELLVMRQMMEQQLASQRWQDMQRMQPGRAAAFRALVDVGLEPELARSIAEEVPETMPEDRAKLLPLGLLGKRLPTDGTDPVLSGGTIALVGPTGVGKTTTIAKLAARFAAVHGTRDLALVTMDTYRIGGQEQLFTYGRLLGAPVYSVGPGEKLEDVLLRLQDRRLVLIDTAGVGQRDNALGDELQRLSQVAEPLQTWLVLAANTQAASQEEAVRRFGRVGLSGCILTKLDETDRAGPSLALTIRQNLTIKYYADGQRVPEDLHAARADRLVLNAMQLSRRYPAPVDDATCVSGFTRSMTAHG